MARGKAPDAPLASVVAYLDWRHFNALPYPGGTFDQPARLMGEMRYVHGEVLRQEERSRKAARSQTGGRRR